MTSTAQHRSLSKVDVAAGAHHFSPLLPPLLHLRCTTQLATCWCRASPSHTPTPPAPCRLASPRHGANEAVCAQAHREEPTDGVTGLVVQRGRRVRGARRHNLEESRDRHCVRRLELLACARWRQAERQSGGKDGRGGAVARWQGRKEGTCSRALSGAPN